MNMQTPSIPSGHPEGAASLDPSTVHATFVLATLDARTASTIRGIWEQLSSLGIRTPIDEHEPPHISLGGVELLDIAGFQRTAEVLQSALPLPVLFSHVGAFGAGDFMWLGATLDEGLRNLHERADAALRSHSSQDPDAMYVPGKWIPHCTLAKMVTPEQMPDFWRVLRAADFTAPASIQGFQLVEVTYPRS